MEVAYRRTGLVSITKTIYTIYMQKDIHPQLHPVIFRDTEAGVDFVGMSTRTAETTEQIEGVDHYVIPVEISSASHPFYTGKDTIIDSAGRVEKFKARAEKKSVTGKKQRVRKQEDTAQQ